MSLIWRIWHIWHSSLKVAFKAIGEPQPIDEHSRKANKLSRQHGKQLLEAASSQGWTQIDCHPQKSIQPQRHRKNIKINIDSKYDIETSSILLLLLLLYPPLLLLLLLRLLFTKTRHTFTTHLPIPLLFVFVISFLHFAHFENPIISLKNKYFHFYWPLSYFEWSDSYQSNIFDRLITQKS